MWADYFKEKDGMETYEIEDYGFISFLKQSETNLHLEHIYVVPEKRREGVGLELLRYAEAAALALGCRTVTGAVRPSARGSSESMAAQLAAGFKILSSAPDAIFTIKELKHG